ncbi:MAG: hypothetical protein HOC70_11140 [Gammaproteobacteria bacterium]|jgi:hypothetical protein|nr:hypothetical protein [Gammaproteobacteria bacterium]MBT4493788.1 hypothetical protein [Gammaproteobacteria bacterium]MBT7369209.1 hypothetical protein [Gammaproteobacteria bacterium]
MPVFLLTEIIVAYPLFVPSDFGTKALSVFFMLSFFYLIFLNVDRNFYLKRTVLTLDIQSDAVLIETLMGTNELPLPCNLTPINKRTRKRHETTYPTKTELYEIVTLAGNVYLSSRMEKFEEVVAQLQAEKS